MKQSKTSLLAKENDFVLNSSNQSSENFTQVIDGYGAEQLVIANSEILLKGDFSRIGSDLVIVGPEGDFSVKERENISKLKKIIPLNINQNILRSETAAISMISIISFILLS